MDLRILPQQQLKVTPKQISANAILQLSSMELQEVIIQALPYVGFPAIASALGAAVEVLRERGLDGGVRTAEESGLL